MEPTIEGLAEFNQKLMQMKEALTKKAVLAGAYKLQEYAQQNAPVDTGFLKNSVESHETEEGAEMIFHANYAAYQEYGTEHMEGRHYIQRALDEHDVEILEAIKNQAEKDLKGGI